jgi:hypothetical protein
MQKKPLVLVLENLRNSKAMDGFLAKKTNCSWVPQP